MTTQLYRLRAHPSSPRSMSSTVARTAIPITHYRILTKEEPAATVRPVARQSRRAGAADEPYVAEALVNSGAAQQANAIAGDFARFGANADRVSGPLDAIVLRKQGIRGVLTRLLVRWGPGSPKVERSARWRASDRPFCDGSSAGGGRPESGGGRAEPVGASRLSVSWGAVRTMRSWSSSGRRRTWQSSVNGPISG